MMRLRSPWVTLLTATMGMLLLAGCEQSAAALPAATATPRFGPTATPAGPRAMPDPTSTPVGKDCLTAARSRTPFWPP
jgi:hypothetical protein